MIDLYDFNEGLGRELAALRGFTNLLELATVTPTENHPGADQSQVEDIAVLAGNLVKNLEEKIQAIESKDSELKVPIRGRDILDA